MSGHDGGHAEPEASGMLGRVLGPVGPEVTCEQCFELLDQYVDLEHAGADADARLPGMQAHLTGCPACHEDYESLRALVAGAAGDGDGPPSP